MLPKNRLLVLWIAALVAAVLSGCGGGGGGGGPTTIPTRADALTNPVTAANAAIKIKYAALARPTPGSVTQSSNVDSSNISIDQVDITAQYGSGGPRFSVRNGTAWSISTSDGNPSRISGTPPPWQGVELGKRIGGGTLYVDAYTDIEAPQTQQGGGGDGTRTLPLGTLVAPRNFSGSTGGFSDDDVNIGGESGHVRCSGGCTVVNGIATGGTWTFTPHRPPGAVDVAGVSGVTFTGTFDHNRTPGTYNGQAGFFRCVSASTSGCGRSTTNGRLTSLQGDWIFVPTGGMTVSTPDTDYLAGGVWLIVPDDATSADDVVFGAFAGGSDPFVQRNLAAVTGTATYTGDAVGVYSAKEAEATTVGYLGADVRLTANFGDASGFGTISGSVANFVVDGTPEPGALNFGTVNIGAQNSGFFRGAVTGADSQRSYTGHWGGQFFGNSEADGRPGSVAGTFGGHSTDDVVSFVGAFGAHKQ